VSTARSARYGELIATLRSEGLVTWDDPSGVLRLSSRGFELADSVLGEMLSAPAPAARRAI